MSVFRINTGARIFDSYHKEGEENKRKVFVFRTNAGASFAYHKEREKKQKFYFCFFRTTKE